MSAKDSPQDRRRQLEELLRRKAEQARRFPLSFSQQRLWVLDQLEPGNPMYNIPLAIRLRGPLDVAALQRTVNELVARHESLRTRIVTADDQPVQVIESARPQELTVLELDHIEPAQRETEAVARARAEARKPFRLDQGSLYRALLLRFSATEHVLVVVLHHIISDDWSVAVLFREVGLLYEAFTAGRPPALAPLAVQYADYAVWQRQRLQGPTLQQLLDYWGPQLRNVPPLDLPTDLPRPPEMPAEGATAQRRLPADLAARLREVARREGATLYMILLAAFQTLLHRYSGQEDFAVGSPIAGRVGKETEGLVGFFVNTLVMRGNLAGNPTFRQLLGQVRQTALAAFEHQELPFERLVEALNPERDTGRQPLFQVMFTLQSVPWPVVRLAGLSFSPLPVHTGTAKFELEFMAREDGDGLLLVAEYRSCLFRAATIRQMLKQFQILLEAIVAGPDQRLADLPLLDEAERHTLLVTRNTTRREYPPDTLLHQLVEAQARRTPEAVAVVFADRQLSYRQLDEQANRLARRLRVLGVGPDALVGIYLERSLELVIGLLGVLKAGGAYVPVDPSYPAERVRFMLADGPVPLVLTQRRLAESLRQYAGHAQVLVLDDGDDDDQRDAAGERAVPVCADHAAYVLYTSGSTGKPKGVVVPHRAICNHLYWMAEEYPLAASDVLLQKTPISFDPSVWEFFAPLMAGARLVLAQPWGHMDPQYLARVIQQEQVTNLRVVPTLLQMLLAEPAFAGCTSLRRVLVGGEALPVELVRRVAAVVPAEICNLYGPTEAAIVATSFRWDGRTDGATVPIGRPMANAEAFVLDAQQRLLPAGVPGELYLGGTGLARGYLNRPELTAERFVSHPFRTASEARLYRTGDLVRWLPDGNLEFLGRLDHQVKIRGNRIELGEIQAALAQHPAVQRAVVTAFDNGAGGKELAAYWVAGQAVPSGDELREFLRRTLPDSMIPSVFLPLDALPLLPNGKVNYAALPRPTHQRDEQRPYVPPRTPDEELLAEIWREVLHVERVGVHDSFFSLGGHSLLATQVMSRIARRLHIEVPLRELFQTPTIAELAERIAVLRSQGAACGSAPIAAISRDGPLPASFAQEALWVLDRLDPGSPVYNVPLAVRLTGPLDADALSRTLRELVARHETLRTKMAVRDGQLLQVVEPIGAHELSIVDLQDLTPAEREAEARVRAAAEAKRPFRLEEGPLFRALLVRLAPTEHMLVLVMHHIISDDWSMGVLFSDLVALYQALAAGRPAPLAKLPIQYADYAACQRQQLQGENLQRLLDYWGPQLQGLAPLELPTDRPRSAENASVGATIDTHLPAALTAGLKEVGRREGATLYMTLLAAFQVLLHRYSGQEDFAVGSPIANRLRPEIESLIGYFINVVVLRTDLAGDPTFGTLLGRVRQTALEAFEHQELPFERLVEAVNPQREAGRHPLFQVLFTFQNAPRPDVRLADLAFSVVPLDTQTSKFELSFTAWEQDGGLALSVEYNSGLFDSDTIERLIGQFRVLLEAIATDVDVPVSRISLASEAERRQVLVDWNVTDRDYPDGQGILDLFERQARQTPQAFALIDGARPWTYQDLDSRANQLAHHLQQLGVGPEQLVAVRLRRSAEWVLALLGIGKAGGAYLPVDPEWPAERLQLVLEDARVKVILTEESLADETPASVFQVVCLDADWGAIAAASTEPAPRQTRGDQLAYVIYTSGSTGRPKGVMIEQRALQNYVQAAIELYEISAADRVLQFASASFDAHVEEVFPCLVQGGTLILRSDEMLDCRRFFPLCEQQAITFLSLPTGFWHELTATLAAERLPVPATLRMISIGGEQASPDRVATWFRCAGSRVRLLNTYGPTEATVVATAAELGPADGLARRVPIGRPLGNVRAYVLDAGGQPVPVGAPGELYLGGKSLARGYFQRPELTAERFVADPFAGQAGARMYKTGDVVRWRGDGRLEFLGRTDHQVKIRGFRIEPGEIEQVLREHPQLSEVAVVAREKSPGDLHLVAYASPRAGESPDVAQLRQYLRQRLPEFMVPSTLVSLASLPMTSSGKVDRRALPAPDWGLVQREREYIAPRTEEEARLAEIWQDILGLEQVGIHDNFFASGGHSLLATQVVSRIARELRIELPLREVFLRPTVAEQAERILELRSQGAAFLAEPIRAAGREGILPASYAQEALWIVEQLEPGTAAYNMPLALRIRGVLDAEALDRAIQEVVARHEALRTTIAVRDGQPIQVIEAVRPQALEIVDLQHLEPAQQEAAVEARATAAAARPFCLDQGPLLRVSLLRLASTEHVLVLVMHHIISDDWSMNVLFTDLVALYQAFTSGRPSPLQPLTIHYADYAVWQRERLQGESLQRLVDYWSARLQGVAPLELPTDRPRSPSAAPAGGTQDTVLPAALVEQLKELGRREGATLYMTLLAAFQVLLYRYSGQEDFAVGSPVANRLRPEIESLIGYFINVVVLRADLSGNPTFRRFLGQVRQTSLEAFEHQELPFERVVSAVNPVRDAGLHPLFQVMFTLQNVPRPTANLGDIEIAPIRLDRGASQFALSFTTWEEANDLALSVEYDAGLFRPESIERMMGRFRRLLEAIVADAELPVSQLALWDDAEQRQVLVDWNATDRDYPRDQCVPELFAEQVRRRPQALALVDGARHWSYAELDERANRLAHHLRSLGVGPEQLVAVRLSRSAEWVMALLGIWKAGGAYLPLDPESPVGRLQFTLEDARVEVLLTEQPLLGGVPECVRHVVCLDADWERIASNLAEPPARDVEDEHLAYVIYTSGSTGHPKGVMIEHRALRNYVQAAIERYEISAADRVLQFASASFDAHVEEVFPCLVQGGTLVLRTDEMLDCRRFFPRCEQQGITFLSLTTAFWHELTATLAADRLEVPATLRMVSIGGEQASPERVALWFRCVGPRVRLLNTYGPTEATVVATAAELGAEDGLARRVPIGGPLGNMRAYVLDAGGQPVPVGVPGELYLGGASLARGYLHRPELTAERFVADPFAGRVGARMYKTGDVVRWRGDGRLEFLGRTDHQVKIRGFRIEPGEIEQVLREHPELSEAAVVARERAAGDLQLVAYTAPREGASPEAAELRQFLRQRLPEFMIPGTFVALAALPMTSSGKVDRRALPTPDWGLAPRDREYLAPRTDDEARLAGIWQEILGLEQVGIHDNFFELGGHSLMATQVVSRIARELQVEVPLREVFLRPTIAELAERLAACRAAGWSGELPPIRPVGREQPLPASYAQEALWVIDRMLDGRSPYVAFSATRIRGPLNVTVFERALNEVLRRHEALRTTFAEREGRPVQVIAPPTPQTLHVVDLSELPVERREAEVQRYAAAQSRLTIDLAAGPLARVELLRLTADEHVVLMGLHHIIYDGWSMAVLEQELLAIYGAFANGRPSPLPELPIQYADYAVWQRERLQGDALETLRRYWVARLDDLPTLELPTDRPRPPVRSAAGGVCRRRLPPSLSQAVEQVSRTEGTTLFMTLLAVFQTLLHRYSGQDDFPLGTPAAGRLRPETENLIGYFVNMLVLRANLAGDPTFRELLGRVREAALEAFEHQELPFESLVQALNPPRDASRHPVFQVILILQNTPEAIRHQQALTDLQFSELSVGSQDLASDFDLALMVHQRDQSLELSLGFRTDLFDEPTIERMLAHFERLLEQATADPGRRLSELPLLSPDERNRMLVDWNRTVAEYPREACLPDLFEAQAARTPEAVAAVCDTQEMTYRELNERANRLAHWLQKRGIAPERLVGLHVERSLDVLVGTLGILKAGGAFLPLDAELPPERLAFMLGDAQVPVLITQAALASGLPLARDAGGEASPRVLCLDADWETISVESGENPARQLTAQHLAYAIYTSGSTGRPKGVLIEQRSVVNVVTSFIRSYALRPTDRVLQSASISFDVSINEIFPALCVGGCVVVPNKHQRLDLDGLAEFVRRHGVTIMAAPPAALARLNSLSDPLPGVRLILSGGEALAYGEVDHLCEIATVVNGYGPTEATICASSFELPRRVRDARATVPIGKPLANYQIYIVDRYADCAAIGCAGELCIGGAGLARGYLNDDSLTSRKFVPNPFVPGQRMYRTGDLARWLADGNLEFLGRLDRQVKIRGHRIELGELEAVLTAHPAIEKAAVVDWQARSGDHRLVAYLVCNRTAEAGVEDEGESTLLAEIKAYLADKVPQYMLPSALLCVDSLPLTSSGKVDRKLLPEPNLAGPDLSTEYVAPRTPLEEQLAALWRDVLGVERVGIRDDFFELGGHSLLAIQAMAQLNQTLDLQVPLRDLFEAPTIERLAQRLEAASGTERSAGLPPIRPAPRNRPIPMSFNQEPFWVASHLQNGPATYIFHPATRLRGPLRVPALEQALNEMVRRHESLRTTFVEVDNVLVQRIAPYRHQRLPVVDLSGLSAERREAELQRYLAAEASQPMDLARGPLLRLQLLKLADDEHVILVGMHHIVYDGWSMSLFFAELVAAYQALAAGLPVPLPEPTIQYADFSFWQRERLQGETYERLRDYWRHQLAGLPVLELPTDRPRPPVRTTHSGIATRDLSPAICQAVQRWGHAEGATTFMCLLAAYQALLQHYSGQDDFAVSTPVAGRLRPETEALVGCLINDLVLRADLSGDPTFRQLLARVRDTVLQAFEHQELPLLHVIRELNPPRDPSRRTLVQVELILQNTLPRFQGWPGMQIEELEPEGDIEGADFDLCLEAHEHDQGMALRLCFHADLFAPATATRLLEHFEMVLATMTANPDGRVSELVLPDAPRRMPRDVSQEAFRDALRNAGEKPVYVPPRSEVESRVASLWAELLRVDRVGIDDDFFALGGDSLLAIRLLLALRDTFQVEVPAAAFFSGPTVAQVAQRLSRPVSQASDQTFVPPRAALEGNRDWSRLATDDGRALVLLQPGGNASPLFCIHGLGGHVANFLPLACELAVGRPVYGLQALGLKADQTPQECIRAMAAGYLNEIRQVQPRGPYALAGWSLGGLIALEAARQLAAVGEPLDLLAMFDTHPVCSLDNQPNATHPPSMPWIARQLDLPLSELQTLSPPQQWERIAERAGQREGRVAADLHRMAAVCQAHWKALAAYRPMPYGGPVVLFQAGGEGDGVAGTWREICPNLRVVSVPGDHYTMLQKPQVDVLVERLRSYLAAPLAMAAEARVP